MKRTVPDYIADFLWMLAILSLLIMGICCQGQNIIPVEANTNGLLLTPSRFLSTNIFGAGNITILRRPTGNGITISNTAGDVTQAQLIATNNLLLTNLMFFDRFTSNYLYSLIVGGGAGEVNFNGNAGTTNATRFGWVDGKLGATNLIKTFEPLFGLKGTNEGGTNLQAAIDPAIVATHTVLIVLSNVLRNFISSRPTNTFNPAQFTLAGGTNVNIKSAANVTNLNSWGSLSGVDEILSGSLEVGAILSIPSLSQDSVLYVDGSSFVSALTIGPHIAFAGGVLSAFGFQPTSANLTNWSLYPTSVLNGWQAGSALLTNFSAMGITNIVAGTNIIVTTNGGRLVINGQPGGSGSFALATNENQFGASTTLTIKDSARLTNVISYGTLTGAAATLSGTLEVAGTTTLDDTNLTPNKIIGLNAARIVQSILNGAGIIFDGTNLTAEVTTTILNSASNALRLVIDSKQHGSALLTNFSAMGITNIVAGTNAVIYTNAGVLVVSAAPGSFTGISNITSANSTFNSLLSQSNQPIVRTISAGANVFLTNNLTNIVIASSSGAPAGASTSIQYNNSGTFGGATYAFIDDTFGRIQLLSGDTDDTTGLSMIIGTATWTNKITVNQIGTMSDTPFYIMQNNQRRLRINSRGTGAELTLQDTNGGTSTKIYTQNGSLYSSASPAQRTVPDDEWMLQSGKVSTTINARLSDTTVIYTCPTNRQFILDKLILIPVAVTNSTRFPTFAYGTTPGAGTDLRTSPGQFTILQSMNGAILEAGQPLLFRITKPAVATSYHLKVIVMGILL